MKRSQALFALVLVAALAGCTLSKAQGIATATPTTLATIPSPTIPATPAGETEETDALPTVLPTLALPTPTETPPPIAAPDPVAARDAALSYLVAQNVQHVELLDLAWSKENVTPTGLAGASTVCFGDRNWTIAVSFPLVAPQATVYHVTVTGADSAFRWEADVDTSGTVNQTPFAPGLPTFCTNDGAQPEVEGAEWKVYTNDDYGFSFRYPSTWTLEQDPAELGVPGGRAPHSVLLKRDTLQLLVQYKQVAEEAMVGPGGHGAGEIVDLNETPFFGKNTSKKALLYKGKVKSTFLGKPVQDLLFWVQFGARSGPGVDYESIDLDQALQDELDQILASFVRMQTTTSWEATGWMGYVVGSPPGAQYDDALVLLPEGAGRVGIAGATPEWEAEIVALRDKQAPGNLVHVWGTLTCNVPDTNGCQLVATRLRYGATYTEPEPVEGWMGTLVGNEPGSQFDDYFESSGRFGVAYGLHSLDAGLQAQLDALRDTGTSFRVWGVLRCGVPDAFGSQIEVTRIEM